MFYIIALAANNSIFKAHSCIERAALLAALPIRKLATDEIFALRGATLAEAIAEDCKKGFIPIAVCYSLVLCVCAYERVSGIFIVIKYYKKYKQVNTIHLNSRILNNLNDLKFFEPPSATFEYCLRFGSA